MYCSFDVKYTCIIFQMRKEWGYIFDINLSVVTFLKTSVYKL